MEDIRKAPKYLNIPAICPFCNHKFDYNICINMQIPGDEDLKKQILDKKMYYPVCPKCHSEFKIYGSGTYIDYKDRNIFFLSEKGGPDFHDFLTLGDYSDRKIRSEEDVFRFSLGLFKRRIVYNVDAFREKILLSDHRYDDRIVELMKLTLTYMLEKERHQPVYRIFIDEIRANEIEFTAIMNNRAPYEYVTTMTPADNYKMFKKKFLRKLGKPEDDKYIDTDQEWAIRSGLIKKGPGDWLIPM